MKSIFLLLLALSLLQVSASADNVEVTIPEERWSILFDSPPLSQKEDARRGANYAFRANSGTFNLTIFVETPGGGGTSHKDCYQFYWPDASRNPMIVKNSVRTSDTDRYVRVEYDLEAKLQGQAFQQRHVNYYFAFRGKWVDVHISVLQPTKADEATIRAFDRSLRYGLTNAR